MYFLVVLGLPCCSQAFSGVGAWASQGGGLPCWAALGLGTLASAVVACRLQEVVHEP